MTSLIARFTKTRESLESVGEKPESAGEKTESVGDEGKSVGDEGKSVGDEGKSVCAFKVLTYSKEAPPPLNEKVCYFDRDGKLEFLSKAETGYTFVDTAEKYKTTIYTSSVFGIKFRDGKYLSRFVLNRISKIANGTYYFYRPKGTKIPTFVVRDKDGKWKDDQDNNFDKKFATVATLYDVDPQ